VARVPAGSSVERAGAGELDDELDGDDAEDDDDDAAGTPAGTGLSAASASGSRDVCTCLVWAS